MMWMYVPMSFSTITKILLKNYTPSHAQDLFDFQLFIFISTCFVMDQLSKHRVDMKYLLIQTVFDIRILSNV